LRLRRMYSLGQIRDLDLRHVLTTRLHQELAGLQAIVHGLQVVRDVALPSPCILSARRSRALSRSLCSRIASWRSSSVAAIRIRSTINRWDQEGISAKRSPAPPPPVCWMRSRSRLSISRAVAIRASFRIFREGEKGHH